MKTRKKFGLWLRVSNQHNSPATWLQQTNQSIVFFSSKLVDLQLRNISRTGWISVAFLIRHISLLSDILFLDFHEVRHQIPDTQDEENCSNDGNHGENVFLAQTVIQVVDADNYSLDDSSCKILWMFIEQILNENAKNYSRELFRLFNKISFCPSLCSTWMRLNGLDGMIFA